MTKQIDVDTWIAPETQDTGAVPDDKKKEKLPFDWYRKPPMDEDEAMEREEEKVSWNQNDEANYQSNFLN